MEKQLIIISQDNVVREMFKEIFLKKGFETLFAADALECVEFTVAKKISFIIVDAALETDLSAYENLELLQSIDDTAGIPLIFLFDDYAGEEYDAFRENCKFFRRDFTEIEKMFELVLN